MDTTHRPILLTSPEGTNSVINKVQELSLEDHNHNNVQGQDQNQEPPSPHSQSFDTEPTPPESIEGESHNNNIATGGNVQFDSEQIQRGRSRIKRRSDFVAKNSGQSSEERGSGHSSRSTSRSFSRSRSRSRSRTASRIRDEEFLKWTVLRQDPSMRLHNYKMKYNSKVKRDIGGNDEDEDEDEEEEDFDKEEEEEEEEEEEDEEEEEEEEEDEDDYEDEEEEEEESDEEQVSDIENDTSINEQFNYDLGTKVLPNFCISINEVLESSKPWIAKYESEKQDGPDDEINITNLEGGYIRGVLTLTKRPLDDGEPKEEEEEGGNSNNDSYILYVDLTSESIYAITYVMGTLVKNGDTVYIVHWHSDRKDFVSNVDITKNIVKLKNHVLHLFDCISATIDRLDVVILSLTHPYPKHLLNEMINGLQPIALCCSLSMTLSGLQNFVCSVPTFIIRKKLKRAKKKGIFD